MAESTHFQDEIATRAAPRIQGSALASGARKLKLFFANAIFWHYERGSWQYDIICALIVAFIFLPRSWFHDRPRLQLSNLHHVQGVVEIGHNKNEHTYLIDARLVESVLDDKSAAVEKPEDAIRVILQRRLKNPPAVKSLDPIRDQNNVVLGFTVVVAQ